LVVWYQAFTDPKLAGHSLPGAVLGLGLSISRTIIAAHGGRLWAENNGDRGATVHCLLPAAKRNASLTNVPDLAAGAGMGGGVAAATPLAM
jgi:K+-sensing histidine kinase KdpD